MGYYFIKPITFLASKTVNQLPCFAVNLMIALMLSIENLVLKDLELMAKIIRQIYNLPNIIKNF